MENSRDLPFNGCNDISRVFSVQTRAWQTAEDILNYRSLHVLRSLRSATKHLPRHQIHQLSHLFVLPEIFYEVLGHLHPLDLYHMSHTSKHFRLLVSSPSSRWLWNLTFERNLPTPPCPVDMLPLKWANLLFGRLKCQDCGDDSEPYPSMIWRRRLCWDCTFDRTFNVIGGVSTLNSVEAQIEREGVYQSFYDPASYKDVQKLADRLGAYSYSTRCDGDPAKIHLRNLETDSTTKDIVASVYETSKKCGTWTRAIEDELDIEKAKGYRTIVDSLSTQLVKSGQAKRRVKELFETPGFGRVFIISNLKLEVGSLKVTKRYIHHNWPTLQKQLEALVANLRRRELSGQCPAVVSGQCDDIQCMWSEYLTSLDAALKWTGTPDILLSEPFVTLLNDI